MVVSSLLREGVINEGWLSEYPKAPRHDDSVVKVPGNSQRVTVSRQRSSDHGGVDRCRLAVTPHGYQISDHKGVSAVILLTWINVSKSASAA